MNANASVGINDRVIIGGRTVELELGDIIHNEASLAHNKRRDEVVLHRRHVQSICDDKQGRRVGARAVVGDYGVNNWYRLHRRDIIRKSLNINAPSSSSNYRNEPTEYDHVSVRV